MRGREVVDGLVEAFFEGEVGEGCQELVEVTSK